MMQRKIADRFRLTALGVLLLLVTNCDLFMPGLGDEVDIDVPQIEVESHRNGDYVFGQFTLTGRVEDDYEVSEVTVSDGDTSITAVLDGDLWSAQINSSPLGDGDRDYQITVTDATGKKSSINLLLTVDNNPPTVLVNVPDSYLPPAEYNKVITLKGEAADTTRIKEVLVSLYDNATGTAIFEDEAATGTSSWYYSFDSEALGNLNGTYYLVVEAFDNAGNSNGWFYHFSDILSSASNPGDLPNIEDINGFESQGGFLPGTLTVPLSSLRRSAASGARMTLSINPDSDRPQFIFISPSVTGENPFASPQRFSGFIEDDDGLVKTDQTEIAIYEYTGDYDDADPVLLPDGFGGYDEWVSYGLEINSTQWTYEADLPSGKEYYLRLKAEDINGLSNTSIPVKFSIPEGVPNLSVLTPQQGRYTGIGGTLGFEVKVEDMSGSLYIDLTPGVPADSWSDALEYPPVPLSGHLLRTEADGEVYGFSFTAGDDFTLEDGPGSFRFRAGVEGAFGQTTWQYIGDTQAPHISLTYPNAFSTAADAVNGTIKISGSADDGLNPLEGVYLSLEPGWQDPEPAPADLTSWYVPTGLSSWTSADMDTTDTALFSDGDGDYTLRYFVKDAAGNFSDPAVRHIRVDQSSDFPVFTFSNLDPLAAASVNILGSGAALFSTLEDDDAVDVSTLEIRIDVFGDGLSGVDLTSDGDILDANESEGWQPAANKPETDSRMVNWNHPLTNLPQGVHSFEVRVEDVYGTAKAVGPVFFTIDTGPPELTVTAPLDNSFLNESFTVSGSAGDANSIEAVRLYLSREDGALEEIPGDQIVLSTALPAPSVNWSYEFAVDTAGHGDDGDYLVHVQADDTTTGVNKTSDTSWTFTIDTSSPELLVTAPVSDELIDGDSNPYTLSGQVSDTGAGVKTLAYSQDYTDDGDDTNDTWHAIPYGGGLRWSVPGVDFSGSEGLKSLFVRAGDGLNAPAQAEVGFYFDLSAPDLSETAAPAVTNGSFSLSGSVSDTNSLDSLSITAKKDGADQGEVFFTGTSGSYNFPVGLSGDGGLDGTWVYTLTASDAAGRTTVINRTVVIDETAPENMVFENPGDYISGNTASLLGTSSDSGSGLAALAEGGVQYSLDYTDDGDDTNDTWNPVAGSSSNWNISLNLDIDGAGADTGLAEGSHQVWVRASDRAGNLASPVSQPFVIDQAAPVISALTEAGGVSWTADEIYNSSDFTMGGTAEDTNGVASVTVTQSKDAGEGIPLTVNLDGAAGDDSRTWTADTSLSGEGSYVYTFSVTDRVGREASLVKTLIVDTSAPDSLTVSAPTPAQTGLDALLGDSYIFRGAASDAGVGIGKIYYLIDQNPGASSVIGDYTALDTSGTWSFFDDFDTDGSGADEGRAEGAWYLHVLAEDKAGNRTAFGSAVTVLFDIDQGSPGLTETDSGITGTSLVYRNSDILLGGSASDGGGLASVTAAYSKNGAAPVQILNDVTGDSAWSAVLDLDAGPDNVAGNGDDLFIGDGTYEFSIKATDRVGKTSSITRNIIIDTASPNLSITSPVDAEFIDGSDYTIRGQVTDNGGKGISLLQYSRSYSDDGDDTNDGWTDIPLTGFNWSVEGLDFSDDGEGAKTLTVRAGDGLNPPVIEAVAFSYDSAAPVLTETLIGSTAQEVSNSNISLGGFATDTNALASLQVKVNGGAAQAVTVDADGADDILGNGDDGSWSFPLPGTAEGTYSLQFTAADTAGRTTTLTRNLVIDKTAPVVSIELPAGGSYISGSSYTARGTVTEANNIAAVDYQVDSSGWLTVFGLENWTQALDLIELGPGDHTLEIRAADEAGNESTSSRSFRVDLANPGISEVGLGSSTGFRGSLFTLSGAVSDDVDVAALTVTESKDGAAAAVIYTDSFTGDDDVSQAWNLSDLPSGGLATGQYDYTVTVTDSAGKSSSLTRTVTIDTDAPNVEITSLLPILSGNRVNGSVTLSVNASDANGLTGVKYFTRTSAGTPDYADADGVLMAAPYSVAIDTVNDLTDNQVYYLYVIGRDKAGNDSVSSFSFTVDQDSDVPDGTIDSPLDGTSLGADNRVRGTFRDDDGVASGGAVLFIRKAGAASYTAKPIATGSSAGQLVAWTLDVSDVTAAGDGSYEMYLSVTDNAAAKAGLSVETADTVGQTFFFDQNVPAVSSVTVTPLRTAYAAGDALTFRWTASDASGLASQAVDVDGTSVGLGSITSPSADTFEVTYTVPGSGIISGTKTFTLVAEDGTGKTAAKTLAFTVDVDAPVVENGFTVNPAFVGFVPNGAFELRGVASDNRGLAGVQVALSADAGNSYGSWQSAVLSSGNWTYAVADSSDYVPAAGDLSFKVRALDEAGNYSVLERTFTQAVDQSADKPVVTVISPVDGSSYGTTVQISGTAADDDNLADLNDDGVLDAGAVEIQYDQVPATGTWTSVNPALTGTGKNANWNYSLVGLAGGNYQVRVRALDDGAVWGDWSPTAEFTVNAGAPNLVVSTTLDSFRSNASLSLSGTVEDSDGVVDVRVRVNGGAWSTVNAGSGSWGPANTSDNWSYLLNLGSDGLKTIEIQAQDASSFIANEQLSTRVDTTVPSGTFDTYFQDDPTGSYIATSLLNGEVRITGTVTELNLVDENPILIRIAQWNGVSEGAEVLPYTAVTGTYVWNYVWDTSALADGQYLLQLSIEDKAGNTTDTVTKVVTTDQSADIPGITQAFVDAPASGDAGNNVLGTLLKVSGTLSDDDGFDTGAVNLYLDGSAVPIAAVNTGGTTATWNYTWSSLSQGEHHMVLEVTDRNGNVETLGPTFFLVDTANPSLTLGSPALSAKIKAGIMTLSGTASDAGGLDAGSLEISLDHTNNASPLEGLTYGPSLDGGTFSQEVPINTGSLDGTLYINLVLTDRAGKQSAVTRNVTIDTTPPFLSLNYPSPDAYINGLISVTGTADDLNGLKDVTLELLDPATELPIANISRSSSTLSAWEFPLNAFSYASPTYGVDVNGDGKLWKVLFRLSATDNSENVTELKPGTPGEWPALYIDTDGDKPTIGVTQPKNGDKIGGFVSMFGTATDDDGPVMQVEVRIDFNGDGNFSDSRDINNNDADGNPATGISLGSDQDILGTTVRIGDAGEPWEDESAWYVVPVSNNSWSLDLNTNNELYASNTGGTGAISLQVRSRDKFGLASEILTRTITLDETFPRIENILPGDQSYQHGTFPLTAQFGDNELLDLSGNSVIGLNVNKTGWTYFTPASPELTFNGDNNGYDLTYQINTDLYFPGSSGILYVDLYVKDQALYQNQKSYTFYVDNQDPSSAWSDRSGAPDGSNLSNGMITVNGVDRTYIEGNYDDAGAVNGVSHIEVYFVDGSGNLRNIKSPGTWTGTPATESIAAQTYSLTSNLWTDTTDPAAPFVNHQTLGDDYVIKVDNPTEMSSQTLGTDVDGDGYEEYMGIVSGAPRWRAYFDSQYLPDGITELHYLVYDLAGNYVHRMREVFIANNGPRADRIQIGSDINANGTVADTGDVQEIGDYYFPAGGLDRSDAVKIKNNRLYIGVEGSDPSGSNQGIKQIFVEAYDAAGVNYLGQAAVSAVSPAGGDYATTLTVIPGTGFWPAGDYNGATRQADYQLKLIIRDNDDISLARWVKLSVINPADSTPPVLTLNPLSQDDQDSSLAHLELPGDNDPAAWAALSAAYGGDDDPKVSGTIAFTGNVTDENRLVEVRVSSENNPLPVLALWNGTELVSQDTDVFVIDSQTLGENGHTLTFTYYWDTSLVTGVAGLNKAISFTADDAGGNGAVPGSQQADVVPFITRIQRNPATYNTYRSRQGWYLLRQGELVTVRGFNLFNTAADTVTFNNTSGTSTAFNLAGGSAAGFTLAALDAAVSSGPVVVTVSGQPSINNLNDNSRDYNTEATPSAEYDGSWLWTDDRYVHVWRSDDNQIGTNRGYFTGSDDPEYPAMSIDGAGVLYGSWSNYADSDILWSPNNGTSSVIYHGYDPSEHTDIHYGNRPTVVFNSNLYGNAGWDIDGAGGTYLWDANARDQFTGTAYNGVYVAEGLYHDQKLMQFINQRVVTDGNNIHTSYYDTDTKALKYYYHPSGLTGEYTSLWINVDGGSDADDQTASFQSAMVTVPRDATYTVSAVHVADGSAVLGGTDILTLSNGTTYRSSVAGTVDLLVSQNDDLDASRWYATDFDLFTVTGSTSRIVDDGGPSRSVAAGEFSAIDVAPGTGYPVIAYYDITGRTVKLARSSAAAPSAGDWSLQSVMASGDDNFEFSGKYITMRIDSQGYVHLAFFRNSTGDLVYLKSTNNPVDGNTAYTFGDSVIIDAIGSVGSWADLTLDNDEPVISYLDSSLVNTFNGIKVAYYDPAFEAETGDTAGEPDTLDGWETMNAALGFEVESVRTSIEADTGTNFWRHAVGYSSSDFFRIGYYVR